MKLLHNLIIVKEKEFDNIEKDGLIIPPSSENNLLRGTVTHIGTHITSIKENDTILFKETAGEEIVLNGIHCRIMTEMDVLAIIDREADPNVKPVLHEGRLQAVKGYPS